MWTDEVNTQVGGTLLLPLPPEACDHQAPDSANAHRCIVEPPLDDTMPGQHAALPPKAPQATEIPRAPDAPVNTDGPDIHEEHLPAVRPRRLPWMGLLKRSLGIDGLQCPRCQSEMVLLA